MPESAGHSVPHNRSTHRLGYDKSAPGRRQPIRASEAGVLPIDGLIKMHHETATRDATPTAYRSPEIGAAMYSLLVPEHGAAEPLGGLRRDAGAALATTCGQNRATGAGAHAQTETVRLGATTVIGLERPLAHWRALLVLRARRDVRVALFADDQMVNDKSQNVGSVPTWPRMHRSTPRRTTGP